jgi:hypothetical protein
MGLLKHGRHSGVVMSYNLPMYGVHLSLADNAAIGLWFTLVSICRSYVLRRWFNGLMLRRAYGRGL